MWKKILDHATNAYDINKELYQQIEDSMNKISCLENKLKNAVNALKKNNKIVKREKLWICWYLKSKKNWKVAYPIMYGLFCKKSMTQVVLVLIVLKLEEMTSKEHFWLYVLKSFLIKKRFPEKIANMLKRTNIKHMEEENKQKILWWFMWSNKDIGRSISSELNNKRNTFVFNVKNSFECVLSAKPEREHLKKNSCDNIGMDIWPRFCFK